MCNTSMHCERRKRKRAMNNSDSGRQMGLHVSRWIIAERSAKAPRSPLSPLSPLQLVRSHILHHVPFELIGNIGPWLSEKGAEMTETHFYESSHLPSVDAVDLLIIMGGPMSVNAESKFRWLIEE